MNASTLSSSPENSILIVDNKEYTIKAGTVQEETGVLVRNNGALILEKDSSLTAETVTLATGTLDITDGTLTVKELVIASGSNTIDGDSIEKSSANAEILVEAGATLNLSKYLYDDLLTWRTFVSNGVLNVEEYSGLDLTQTDIEALIQINSIRNVIFNQPLNEIHKLSFQANSIFDISFFTGFGTDKDDSITINKNAVVALGNSEYNINLKDGKNTVSIKNNAVATFRCGLANVATISISSGSKIKTGKLSIQKFTTADFSNIVFSNHNASLKIGAYVDVFTGYLTSCDNRSNKISVDKNSFLSVDGDILNFNTITVSSGTKFKDVSSEASSQQHYSSFISGNITSTAKTSKYTFKNYVKANVGNIITGANKDTLSVGDHSTFESGTIAMGGNNDTIKVGSDSTFTAGTVKMGDGKNSFSEKGKSRVTLASLEDVYKLDVSSGSKDVFTELYITGAFTGTNDSSKFTFGNYTNVEIGSIESGVSNDTLSIGKKSIFTTGSIQMELGDDKITIGDSTIFTASTLLLGGGKNSFTEKAKAKVSLDSLEGVNKCSLSNGSKDDYTVLNISGNYTASDYNDKLTIGNYADVNIHGGIDFVDGKDELTVGSNSVVVLKADLTSALCLNKFTLGKGTVAYLSTAIGAKITTSESTLEKNKTIIYNIGDYETALAFTSIGTELGQENADDKWQQRATLETGTYSGWLCGKDLYEGAKLDTSDFFDVESINSITFNASQSVALCYYTYDPLTGGYKMKSVTGTGEAQKIDVSAASFIEMTCLQDTAAVKYTLLV